MRIASCFGYRAAGRRGDRSAIGLLATGLVILAGAARAGLAQQAEPADPRIARAVSLEVRAATVGNILDRLSQALDVSMDADRGIAAERVTLYAPNARVESLQAALAALYQTGWTPTGQGAETSYRLRSNEPLNVRADALRAQRRSQFLAGLLQTEQEIGQRGAAVVAQRLRTSVAQRRTDLPADTLNQVTTGYVSQTLLLEPLRFGLAANLLRSGMAWSPLTRLNSRQLALATEFYLGQSSSTRIAGDTEPTAQEAALDPAALRWPRARIEYRLLYGDRWTGETLLTRVGTSDSWASGMLTSALYPLPDYATLYPEAARRPTDTDSYRPIDVKIDPTLQTFDQALASISRGAGINVISDSYLRPDVFRPAEPRRLMEGATLAQLLDKVADYYGYVWWKQGEFYLFRHRMWGEERRVAVPDRVLQQMGTGLAAHQTLSPEALNALASLSDEQLLSLHLYGSATGKTEAAPAAFDYEELSLVHAGLMLFSQLTDNQRELARGRGLPFMLMSPPQQFIFGSLAYDRGVEALPDDQSEWGFRLSDRFNRQRVGSGWAEVGQISMDFDYGLNGVRTARMAARAPAHDKAPRSEEQSQ